MNKLELKHIVGYLPYGLKVYTKYYDAIVEPTSISKDYYLLDELHYSEEGGDFDMLSLNDNGDTKPILRPIGSMTKEEGYQLGVLITHEREMEDKSVGVGKIIVGEWEVPIINYIDINGDEYSFMVMFCNHGISATNDNNITFEAYEWLYENHFDIHGLIGQGLAIDINTLKP